MDDAQRRRLAENELMFRDINERIDRRAERWEELGAAYHRAVCECSDTDCVETLPVTAAEHRMVRRHADRFLVARGHDNADIERVVYRSDRFWIVEKHPDLSTT